MTEDLGQHDIDEDAAHFLHQLPDALAAARLTWQRISQSLWSQASFEKLFDAISDINSQAALYNQTPLEQHCSPLQEYLSGLLETGKVPTSRQIDDINQLFDQLDQAITKILSQRHLNQPKLNPAVFMLCQASPASTPIADQLTSHNYQVHGFDSIDALVSALETNRPAVIIVETSLLPGIEPLKAELQRQKSHHGYAVPLVFLSSEDDIRVRIAAMRAGAVRYFSPPHDPSRICAEVMQLATPQPHAQNRVLIIEDDPTQADFAASVLGKAGMLTECVYHPLQVMQALKRFDPDIILMDIYMPDADGMELTSIIRDDMRYATTPIIFLSGETNPEKQVDALLLGGDDFISKPIRPKFLIAAIRNRLKRTQDLINAIRLQLPGGDEEPSGDTRLSHSQESPVDVSLLEDNPPSELVEPAAEAEPSENDLLLARIREGLEDNAFQNFYQPLLNIQGKTNDYYMLSQLLPGDPQPMSWQQACEAACQSDLLPALDRLAVEQAIESVRELMRDGKQGMIIARQSSADITNDLRPDWIRDALRAGQMVGTSLVLSYSLNELTNSIKSARSYFSRLRDMGIRVCLADFPAKKAAFKLINYLRVDYVEVSEKLLETDNNVINTFINHAHKLKVQVIVANISDPRYVNLHWTSNADFISGDFISPASETMNFNFSQAAL